MAQKPQKETSGLSSLKELMSIEEDRIKQEDEDRRRRTESPLTANTSLVPGARLRASSAWIVRPIIARIVSSRSVSSRATERTTVPSRRIVILSHTRNTSGR